MKELELHGLAAARAERQTLTDDAGPGCDDGEVKLGGNLRTFSIVALE